MRALAIVAALGAVAHAGPSKAAKAVARAGFTKVTLRASSHGGSVFRAKDGDGKTHWVFVDSKMRVADLGVMDLDLDDENEDAYTLVVTPFLGRKDLLDVAVWSRSALVPADTSTWHSIVRTKPFELACDFSGSGTSADENGTVTSQVLADDPLSWRNTIIVDGPKPRVAKLVYTLDVTGFCQIKVEK